MTSQKQAHPPADAAEAPPLPADGHVHTEYSWDASRGDMAATCARALDLGLPGIVITEHSDFVHAFQEQRPLDVAGYAEAVERCRQRFPDLKILLGVEVGEPHWFPDEVRRLLEQASFDRVLGSVHCVGSPENAIDWSQSMPVAPNPAERMRLHLAETLKLIESDAPFHVFAHLDYPKRYWPKAAAAYDETEHEEQYRAVLRAAARRGSVLEVNSTRGMAPATGLCPGPLPLKWWREEGGEAVAFGSDAHSPDALAKGFEHARHVVEAAGFKPAKDPLDFWRR
ncbi:MAG TPA: histidinol-phosphatase HisJ family protein [Candidatus Dormibacteraeota bacterium]